MADKLSILKTKAASFCAYQERSTKQVEEKLLKLSATTEETEKVIIWLNKESFLNEIRFAKAYTEGKFRLKKWGRNKIMSGLRKHGVDDSLIQQALKNLDSSEYQDTLIQLHDKKRKTLENHTSMESKKKLINFLTGKGFELELVLDMVNQSR